MFQVGDFTGFGVAAEADSPGAGVERPDSAGLAIGVELKLVSHAAFEQGDDAVDVELFTDG